MKSRILDNKRGIAIEDVVPLIIFLFVAAFGIFLFKINEQMKSKSLIEDIQLQKDILIGHEALMEYLKEVDVNGDKKADFISKSIIDKDYDRIKKDVMNHFSKSLGDINLYIDFKDSSKKLIFPSLANAKYSPQEQYSSTQTAYPVASALTPISGTKADYISIELFFSR